MAPRIFMEQRQCLAHSVVITRLERFLFRHISWQLPSEDTGNPPSGDILRKNTSPVMRFWIPIAVINSPVDRSFVVKLSLAPFVYLAPYFNSLQAFFYLGSLIDERPRFYSVTVNLTEILNYISEVVVMASLKYPVLSGSIFGQWLASKCV